MFELANMGTIFLDEMASLRLSLQPKILRVLETQTFRRIGGTVDIQIDVRVIAATNRDLQVMVQQDEFREDLYYRLKVMVISLPPLRERVEDILPLAAIFIEKNNKEFNKNIVGLSEETQALLLKYRWPGNVRELKNIIEGAAILADGPEIGEADLRSAAPPVPGSAPGGGTDWFAFGTLDAFRDATEKEFIRRKLLENGGNIKRTAERIELHEFEREVERGVRAGSDGFFEGCLPIEILAQRGREALAFGPMRPVGLSDPRTGRWPHAVVQLRQDNLAGTLYNLVGFQTNIKWGDQERVLRMIPGLANAEFVRFGQMHRNTFINSPKLLLPTLQWRSRTDLFFAGQLTGTEGYVGSAASGLVAGLNAWALVAGHAPAELPATTMLAPSLHT